MRRLFGGCFAILAGIGLACSSFQGSNTDVTDSDAGDAGTNDAGVIEASILPTCTSDTQTDPANCGTCGHACATTESCTIGQCVAGCPNGTLYVSASGSDQNSGCDQKNPKATITSALGYVKTLALTHHEIHVCAGTYVENGITLDYPVTLRGGYECSLWQRHAPFAWFGIDPTTGLANFDSTNETIIDAGTATSALSVSGVMVDQSVTVEGFTIRGAADVGGSALFMANGASASITNDKILGALGGASSFGVHTKDTVSSEISHCLIRGGAGGTDAGPGTGSTGILMESMSSTTAPTVHDNEIGAGTGKSGAIATLAVEIAGTLNLTGTHALKNNAIVFQGSSSSGKIGTYGVFVLGNAKADIVGNSFYGGTLSCTTMPCTGFSVYVAGSGSTVIGNRILSPVGAPASKPPNLYPVYVQGGTSGVTIENNLVTFAAGNVTNATGIFVPPGSALVRIDHNTIIVPTNVTADGISVLGQNVNVDENLIVGARYGLLGASKACTDSANELCSPPATLNDNAFVNVQTTTSALPGQTAPTDPCGAGVAATNTPSMELLYPGASGNVSLAKTCMVNDGACVKCAATDCFGDLFASAAFPATSLVTGALPFSTNATCLVTKGGGADLTIATDIVGTPRTSMTSIGALEDDGACSP